jgi:hypothetical protein
MTEFKMPGVIVPDHVERADRYVAGAHARIKSNAWAGRRKRFIASAEDAARLIDFLEESGEFGRVFKTVGTEDAGYEERSDAHPVVRASYGQFYSRMRESLIEWGGLTEGQANAVRNMLARAEQRLADRAAKREAERAADAERSQYIGKIGERIEIEGLIYMTFQTDSEWGTRDHYMVRTDDGSVIKIACSGSPLGCWQGDEPKLWMRAEYGDRVKIRGTVKRHMKYQGVAQTILQRAKCLGIIGPNRAEGEQNEQSGTMTA